MATGRRSPGDPPDGEIPDLDLGAPRSAPSPRSARSPASSGAPGTPKPSAPEAAAAPAPSLAPASRGPHDYFGSGNFDDDQTGGDRLSIALDTGGTPAVTADGAAASGNTFAGSGADDNDLDLYEGSAAGRSPSPAKAAASAPDKRKWPTGTSPDPASLRLDTAETARLSGYGPAPASALLAPPYAIRVLRQKRALGVTVKALALAFTEAERQRDELLVPLVQDNRGKILMTGAGEALFEPIVAIERVALERRSALAGTSAEYDARVAEVANLARVNERDAEGHRGIIEERTRAHEALVLSFERADARKKRLYIELGGLVSISEKTGGKLTPEQSASVARLEGEIAGQKPELDACTRAMEASRAVLAAAEADLRKNGVAARDIERRRRALDQEAQKQLGAHSQGVTEADEQRFLAFTVVGRKILAEKGRLVDVRPEVLDALARADQLVVERATELEKYARARDAYDPDTLKRGMILLAVVAVVLLGALGLLVAR